jgi:hypothetical protein
LRDIAYNPNTPFAELKLHLYEILIIEERLKLLTNILSAKSLDDAMIRLEQALPDLLHLESRSSEAIISHLLRMGYHVREGDKQLLNQFFNDIQRIINERIFGSPGCASNWTFPLSPDGTVGEIKFANWRSRKIIESIDEIIEVCLPGDS